MAAETTAIREKYTLVSVERAEPPQGTEGGSWYSYTIGHGKSTMTGLRRGTLKQVKDHAETLAHDLNERRGMKVTQYGRHGSKI